MLHNSTISPSAKAKSMDSRKIKACQSWAGQDGEMKQGTEDFQGTETTLYNTNGRYIAPYICPNPQKVQH